MTFTFDEFIRKVERYANKPHIKKLSSEYNCNNYLFAYYLLSNPDLLKNLKRCENLI